MDTFGSIFAEVPYPSPPNLDIDLLINIAEARSAEAQDELWLLQTDLAYLHDRARYHEARWFDKVPGTENLHFTAKEKLDNVGFIVTIKPLLRARGWQWLFEGCQAAKVEMEKFGARLGWGRPLTPSYESALGSLQLLLERVYAYYQIDLKRYMLRLSQFRRVFETIGVGNTPSVGKFHLFDVRDYSTLYHKYRIDGVSLSLNPGRRRSEHIRPTYRAAISRRFSGLLSS